MLLKIRTDRPVETPELHDEFWFGQALSWSRESDLYVSLLVEAPRVVHQTMMRGSDGRQAVGYCDDYPFSACGLMALAVSRLQGRWELGGVRVRSLTLVAVPESEVNSQVARRLFAPMGYEVELSGGVLALRGEHDLNAVLRELPALLLAFDRRTRHVLSEEERNEIALLRSARLSSHPAAKAIDLALEGDSTPLRLLVAPRVELGAKNSEETVRPVAEVPSMFWRAEDISAAQKKSALERFSRVNFDHRWLIYLPAGVASLQARPCDEELERPEGAIEYYRDERIERVVVQEKHMGSRGIVVVCRDSAVASNRFGIETETPGCVYTRNGRRFFSDSDTEAVFIDRVIGALSRSNFWKRFSTDWVCLDGEVLPWAIKAAESSEESRLVELGFKVVRETLAALEGLSGMAEYWRRLLIARLSGLERYNSLFRRYRGEEVSLSSMRFAPFHLLATEGKTYSGCSHLWHMETLCRVARSGEGFLIPTRYEVLETNSRRSWKPVLKWWNRITAEASEGLMVKPFAFAPVGRRGLAQPALKCRTREHLRLVYGSDYDSREARELLADRGALRHRRNKHRRILRQFAMSVRSLNRFVERDSLDAVHAAVLRVLAEEVPPIERTLN